MTEETFFAYDFQYIMCGILVWDFVDIIPVYEEN